MNLQIKKIVPSSTFNEFDLEMEGKVSVKELIERLNNQNIKTIEQAGSGTSTCPACSF